MKNLGELVHRGKQLRKSLGKQMKRLRKRAKRVIYDEGNIDEQRARASLTTFRAKLREVLELEATRVALDAEEKADLEVGGQVLMEGMSMAQLVVLRQEVKYHQKLYRRLRQAMDDPEVAQVAKKLETLRNGVEASIKAINGRPIGERSQLGEVIDAYLFEGTDL